MSQYLLVDGLVLVALDLFLLSKVALDGTQLTSAASSVSRGSACRATRLIINTTRSTAPLLQLGATLLLDQVVDVTLLDIVQELIGLALGLLYLLLQLLLANTLLIGQLLREVVPLDVFAQVGQGPQVRCESDAASLLGGQTLADGGAVQTLAHSTRVFAVRELDPAFNVAAQRTFLLGVWIWIDPGIKICKFIPVVW